MKEKILSYLLKKDINFWDLASRIEYMPEFYSVFKDMRKKGLVDIKDSYVFITEKGKKMAKSLKLASLDLNLPCPCDIKIDNNLLKDFRRLRKDKAFEKKEYDQLQITTEELLKKVEVMRRLGDIKNKRIVCLGDDDQMAIALALTKLPKEITVLDVDQELLDYENKVLEKLGYGRSAFTCNFLNPLPERFKGKYDVFITEPPDTIEGITLFFSRGIDSLKNNKGIAYLGVSRNDLSDEKLLQIQSNITKMKGLVTDMFAYFEGYNPSKIDFTWVFGLPKEVNSVAKTPWFFADLLRIKVLKGAKPMIKGKKGKKFCEEFIKTEIYLN